jgi:hypothetical protein
MIFLLVVFRSVEHQKASLFFSLLVKLDKLRTLKISGIKLRQLFYYK